MSTSRSGTGRPANPISRPRPGARARPRPRFLPTAGAARGWLPEFVLVGLVTVLVGFSGSSIGHPTSPSPIGATHSIPSASSALAAARISAQRGFGPGAAPRVLGASPASAPATTDGVAMAYDAADQYVVAVTPNATGSIHNTTYGPGGLTWAYSGGNWSVVNTTGAPPNLLYPSIAYDVHDGYVVLYGGIDIAGVDGATSTWIYSDYTWTYSGGVWTNRTATSHPLPPVGSGVPMAYDGTDGYVVLYSYPSTWTYQAGNWTQRSGGSGAYPPIGGSMAYDAADGCLVYFGGIASGPGPGNWTTMNDTWQFAAGTWTNVTANVTGAPIGRVGYAMAYDPAIGSLVLFGGIQWTGPQSYVYWNDTWAYSAGAWTDLHLTTPGTVWFSFDLVYDGGGGQLVLAGATNTTANATSTESSIWLLNSSSWSAAAPLLLLAGLGADAGTPFELAVRTAPHSGTLGYQYAGLPVGCRGLDRATLTCSTQTPGEYRVRVTVTDTAGFSIQLSSPVVVHAAPSVDAFSADLPVAEVGYPVEFSTNVSGGTGAISYAYSGLPAGCASVSSGTLSCVPTAAGTATVSIRMVDALGVAASAGTTLRVQARPAVTTFEASPAVIDAGQSVVFAALTSGGIGPMTYDYQGLPSDCPGSTLLSFACSPEATGSYSVSFSATDSFGSLASGTAGLTIHPLPTISTFYTSDGPVPVGAPLDLSLSVSGGVAPYTILYTGLPGGCVSADTTELHCSAVVPGAYTVTAQLTDATGATVSLSAALAIVGSAPTGSGPGGGTSHASGSSAGISGGMFWSGLGLGIVGVAGVAFWSRRQAGARSEGEAIVAELRRRRRTGPVLSEAGPAVRTGPPAPPP